MKSLIDWLIDWLMFQVRAWTGLSATMSRCTTTAARWPISSLCSRTRASAGQPLPRTDRRSTSSLELTKGAFLNDYPYIFPHIIYSLFLFLVIYQIIFNFLNSYALLFNGRRCEIKIYLKYFIFGCSIDYTEWWTN